MCREEENSLDQHIQILREESMLITFFTNNVFFFVGNATVYMPYLLRNSHVVVLVPSTQSTEREWKVSTSIEARRIMALTIMLQRNGVVYN